MAEGFDDIRKQFINNRIDTEELKIPPSDGHCRAASHHRPNRCILNWTAAWKNFRPPWTMPAGPALRDRARGQADDILLAMLNRDGLTVLLHPETGDDYTDHTAHACWFGAVLPLRVEVLRRGTEQKRET